MNICSCYKWVLPSWLAGDWASGSRTLLRSSDSHHPQELTRHAEELTGPASLREISWTSIFISSWTVLFSSFTVHNENGWQNPQNSARRFSFLVFFGPCVQGTSFFPDYLKGFPSPFWFKLLNYQLCSWQQLMTPERIKLHGLGSEAHCWGNTDTGRLRWGKDTLSWKAITIFYIVIKVLDTYVWDSEQLKKVGE